MDENLIDGSIRIKAYVAKYDPHSSNYSAPINNSHSTRYRPILLAVTII